MFLCLNLYLFSGLPGVAAQAAPAREVVAPPASMQPAPGANVATPLQEGAASTVLSAPPLDVGSLNPAQPFPVALSWRLDKTGRLTPEEVLSPAQQSFFAPFVFTGMSKVAGTCWFRLDLAAYDGRNGQFYLDLNTRVPDQLPSDMRVWLVSANVPPQVLTTDTPGLYALPNTFGPATLFVRAAGIPALGFEPTLRSAGTITVLDSNGGTWLRLILAGALLLGLLRGIVEQREWRMWAALYAGALLVTDVWGFPAVPDGHVRLLDLPGLLAPGVALLLLPHVGRHIMRTREQSGLIDFQFILMGVVGLALTLVPLLSTHVWTVRYLPLWPLGMLLLLPTTLTALCQKIPGAGRFLWISLLPPLGLLAFLPMPLVQFASPESAGWWTAALSLLPPFTLALSSLFIAFSPTPRHVIKPKRTPATLSTGGAQARPVGRTPDGPLALDPVADTPTVTPPLVLDDASRMTPPPVADSALPLHNLERRMRGPLDVLLNEIGALDQLKLPRELVDHAHRLSRAGRQLALLIGDISSGRHGNPVAVRGTNGMDGSHHKQAAPFDLYEVILQAHNAVAEVAEAKNLALSWFTAPHLARSYLGEGDRLARVLTLLAESAVHATDRGIVQIRVQRLPESNDPGQLLFTVSDTGKGAPPLQRSSISLVQVWELVGPSGGTLNVESGPTGTSIAFSLRLQMVGAERTVTVGHDIQEPALRTTLSSALRILVVSDVPGSRQLLTYYLDELPHEVREARSADEALGMYSQAPGALLIFDGDLPEADVVRTVAAIRAFEGEHNYPLASILALVKNDEQMERLRRAGCTHTLLKPVSRTELRQLALRLAPVPRPRAARPDAAPTPVTSATSKASPASENTPTPSAPQDKKSKKPSRWSLLPTLQPSKDKAPEQTAEELECLKTPKLDVRSNVSDPKPIPRTTPPDRPQSPRAPLPQLPPLSPTAEPDKAGASGMPELKMDPPAPPAARPSPTPPTPPHTDTAQAPERARIVRGAEAQPAGPRSATDQILDDMLREAESTPVSPARRVEQAVAQTSRERKPIPWRVSRPSETSLAAAYSPHDHSEWVGEPMPVGTPIGTTGSTAPGSGGRSGDAAQAGSAQPPARLAADRPEPEVRETRRVPGALGKTPALAEEPQKSESGFFRSFFDVFQKKPSPEPTLYTAPVPSPGEWVGEPTPIVRSPLASSEWVGEPMPIVKQPSPLTHPEMTSATGVATGSAASSAAGSEPTPVVPLASLTTPASPHSPTDLTGQAGQMDPAGTPDPLDLTPPPPPAEEVPLTVNDVVPDLPAPEAEKDFDVPAEEMVVDVQAEPPAQPDPLAPVMAEDPARTPEAAPAPAPMPAAVFEPVPAPAPEPKPEPRRRESIQSTQATQPVAAEESPRNAPLRMAAPSRAPVTRLYLPGMEPAPPAASELRLVDMPSAGGSEDIYTLTDVVPDVEADMEPETTPHAAPGEMRIDAAPDGGLPLPVTAAPEYTAPADTTQENSGQKNSAQDDSKQEDSAQAPEPLRTDTDGDNVEELLELLDDLNTQARAAFDRNDAAALQKTAARLAEAASALGLHGLIDLALCLEEEARSGLDADSGAASLLTGIDESVRHAKM